MAEREEDLPRDAKIVKSLLRSMGVEEHEPRVVHQFLELWYRYVVDILTDAQVYSEYAGKGTIDSDDTKLAIQSKANSSFSKPPSREVFLAPLFSLLEKIVCLFVHLLSSFLFGFCLAIWDTYSLFCCCLLNCKKLVWRSFICRREPLRIKHARFLFNL